MANASQPFAPQSSGTPMIGGGGQTYNPAQVMMKQPSSGGSQPYLQPSTVRATGSGPFDNAYRQDLATYAGGQFTPQSGNGQTNFNPTGQINFGNPVGGGNAPTMGLPTTLLGQALGGQAYQYAPPPTSGGVGQSSPTRVSGVGGAPNFGTLQTWLEQFMGGAGQLPGVTNNG